MKPFLIFANSEHQLRHGHALARGLAVHGVDYRIMTADSRAQRGDLAAVWGWRRGARIKAQGYRVLCMERGYLGDRMAWTSLGWDGLNGYARFPALSDPSRFERHFAHLMKPWKRGGDYVLLLGQVPGDMSLAGRNLGPWYLDIAARAAKAYKLPVIFRPHPKSERLGHKINTGSLGVRGGPLDEALAGAAVAITWNSNSAVDAVMAGVPTLTFDVGAMAYEVTGHKLGERLTPDRADWANRLAWKQWTIDEISDGTAWAAVKRSMNR